MKRVLLLLLSVVSCGATNNGPPYTFAVTPDAEGPFQEALLALENEGCAGFLAADSQATIHIERLPGDIEHHEWPEEDICGYWQAPGLIKFGSSEEAGCQSLFHEIAHALDYDHMDGDLEYTFMWSYGTWQTLEQQAYQFANLTGCRSL